MANDLKRKDKELKSQWLYLARYNLPACDVGTNSIPSKLFPQKFCPSSLRAWHGWCCVLWELSIVSGNVMMSPVYSVRFRLFKTRRSEFAYNLPNIKPVMLNDSLSGHTVKRTPLEMAAKAVTVPVSIASVTSFRIMCEDSWNSLFNWTSYDKVMREIR